MWQRGNEAGSLQLSLKLWKGRSEGPLYISMHSSLLASVEINSIVKSMYMPGGGGGHLDAHLPVVS